MYLQTSVGIAIEKDRVTCLALMASVRRLTAGPVETIALEGGKSQEERTQQAAQAVRQFLAAHRLTPAGIFLSLPRELTMLRFAELPAAAKENLRATLEYELEKYVPLAPDEIYFDYQVLAEDKETRQIRVMLLIARRADVLGYARALEEKGVRLSGIEIAASAIGNALLALGREQTHAPQAFLLADDGRLDSGLLLHKSLVYSRTTARPTEAGETRETLERECRHLVSQVPEPRREEVLEITLGGLTAEEQDQVVAALGAAGRLRPPQTLPAGLAAAQFLPAYGLGLRGLRQTPMALNLLPAPLRRKAGRAGLYAMAVLGFLVILTGLSWGVGHFVHQRRVLNQVNAELAVLQVEVDALAAAEAETAKLEEELKVVAGLRGRAPAMVAILKELSDRIPNTAWLRGFTFSDKGIQLEGYADSASELILAVEESPLFKNVAFQAPITKDRDGKERFRIGIQLD